MIELLCKTDKEELEAKIESRVKTINGVAPDKNGNVVVSGSISSISPSSNYSAFKAVFLGDSQTAVNVCKTKIWWEWVVELLGITNYVNYGQNGATLTNLGETATPICNKCQNMVADASMIFVMGGVNEFRNDTQSPFGTITNTTPETIYGAVRYICQKLQTKYPKAPIIFITPTNQKLWTHKDGHSMSDLAKAITDACHMEGVLCLDAQGSLGINPAYDGSYTSDGLHLNDLGSELLGKWVANQVKLHVPILDQDNGGDSGDSDDGETEVTLSSISATYSGGSVPVGTNVNDLTGIVVTAHYSNGTNANVTGYTLSGAIVEGNNTITVNYGGKSTTFTVTGTADSGGETPEQPVTYTVINNLTNVNTNNTATNVTEGESYTAILTAVNGYEVDNVTVTMSGADITATVLMSDMIVIESVTGDIVITATAVKISITDISAVFNQGGAVVRNIDELDTLRQYLTVTAIYSDGTSKTVSDYTLSGTLVAETSTITVTYSGKTTIFTVTVTEVNEITLNLSDYSYSSGHLDANGSPVVQGAFMYSEKISIPANTEITFMSDVKINPLFYDANENFISAPTVTTGHSTGNPSVNTYTTPENCAYLVLNMTVQSGVDKYWIKYFG